MTMSKHYLLVVAFFFCVTSAKAQVAPEQIYVSRPGKIALLGIYNDDVFVAKSNELQTTIDYQLGTVIFKLKMEKLTTGVEVLDSAIRAMRLTVLKFKGQLEIVAENEQPQNININGYTKENFPIRGVLQLNGIEKDIVLDGELLRLTHSGNVGSQLFINFEIRKDEFGLFEGIEGIYENFHVEISQPLLINWKN